MKITVIQEHYPQTITVVREGAPGADGEDGESITGATGDKGWSPVYAAITYGVKVVWQIVDWVGGEGAKPATGNYIGATGYVSNIADATDMRGATGADGVTPTVSISTVTSLPEGSPATVTNVGTPGNVVLEFGIPTGPAGPQGDPGPAGATGATGAAGNDGADGIAATITVGTVTTGTAGSSVAVSNVGTPTNAVFDITIPRGDTGAIGPQQVYSQPTQPASIGQPYLWVQTGLPNDGFTIWIDDGV